MSVQPQILACKGKRLRFFLNLDGSNVFRLGIGQGNNHCRQSQQDGTDEARDRQERHGNVNDADPTTPHRGDFLVFVQEPHGKEGGHEHGKGHELKGDVGDFTQKIHQHGGQFRVVSKKPSEFFKKIDHQVNRDQSGKTQGQDSEIMSNDVPEQDPHVCPACPERSRRKRSRRISAGSLDETVFP